MDSPFPQKHTKKSRPMVAYIAGALILVALFVFGYIPKMRNTEQLNQASHEVSTTAPEVAVEMPRLAVGDPLSLPGDIEAISTTSVQARTTGYIVKMYADIGSIVKRGQVLADVESPDVDQQLAQANADTQKSRATVTQSQANVEQLKATVIQGEADVSHQRALLAQSQAALEGSNARKAQAEAGLLQAKAALLRSQQQVNVQRASFSQAQAQYALASANIRRYRTLLSQGFVSQQDYDTSEATFRTNSATIESARANISAAEADVKAAEEVIKSNEELVRAAEADRKSSIANIKAAEAALASSAATVQAQKSNVSAGQYTVKANVAQVGSSLANERRYGVLRSFEHVVAPFDGVITTRNVDVGSLVSPGATSSTDASATTPGTGLFGIARVDTLRIFVDVPQSVYQAARSGTEATVKVRELPNYSFKGFVKQSAGAINSTTRTLQTEIRIPNPKDLLLPGMYAQVEFSRGTETKLRVPADTLIIDAKGIRVVVVDKDKKIHYRNIVTGRDYGTEVEVVSGIEPTDQLVSVPSDDLTEGETVTIQKPQAKPAGGAKS